MPLALPALLELAGLIVALVLIFAGKAFVDALLAIVRKVTKAVPFSGFLIGPVAEWALQKLSNKMGVAANDVGGAIAGSWNYLATVTERTGWAVFHAAQAAAKLQWYVEVAWPLNQLWQRAQDAYQLAGRAAHSAKFAVQPANVINKFYTLPAKSPLAPAIRSLLRPLEAKVSGLEAWARTQLAAMSAAVAGVAAPGLALPRLPFGDLAGALARIRARLGRLEAGKAIGLGAVAYALTKLGLGWARCANVRQAGRLLCRMDGSLIDELFGAFLLIGGTVSIVELARALQGVTDESAELVRGFVREA